MTHNEVSKAILDVAFDVHRQIGPGLLESAYAAIMAFEFKERRLRFEKEVPVPIRWKSMVLDVGYRADSLVDDRVIVELKSLEEVATAHHKQLLTYLRCADKRPGLLLNFGAPYLKDGIFRIANGLDE